MAQRDCVPVPYRAFAVSQKVDATGEVVDMRRLVPHSHSGLVGQVHRSPRPLASFNLCRLLSNVDHAARVDVSHVVQLEGKAVLQVRRLVDDIMKEAVETGDFDEIVDINEVQDGGNSLDGKLLYRTSHLSA